MHILLLSYEFPPFMATGGIGSYMYHLAHLLSKKGHTVTVFSATTQHTTVTKLEQGVFMNYVIPAANTTVFREAAAVFFQQYIKTHTVDIIESPEVGACALLIKQQYPAIPLVVKMHSPGVLISKVSNTYQSLAVKLRYVIGAIRRGKIDLGYWAAVDRNREKDPEFQICQLADRLLSPTLALKKWASSYWQLKPPKIALVPNPFVADTDLFHYPIDNRDKTICFVGKLTVLKGMFALTPAIKELAKLFPDHKFILAGRDEAVSAAVPSMQQWMERELAEVRDRMQFTGALSRAAVKQLLGKSAVCIVPSLWENYPTVVLEAMAAGCAVVAANRGGIPELIKDGETGLLFPAKDSNTIVKKVCSLLQNPEQRKTLAAAARNVVQQQHKETFNTLIEQQYTIALHGSAATVL